MGFQSYNPDQAYLLPPSVRDVLGGDHLCFFVHRVVEHLDLGAMEGAYGVEGRPAYAPALMVKVWLYAYCLGLTSSRRVEQRLVEDLAFRYLAGNAHPDFWTLNDFRRRHGRALNDLFTQVVELAREAGLVRLGHVAIDSTRVAANASADRVDTVAGLRRERARIRRQIRRWQKQCDAEAIQEAPGQKLSGPELAQLNQRLASIPRRLEVLSKQGATRCSRTDPDSRFLRTRRGFVLGYTVTVAVNEDHLILDQRVSQAGADTGLLLSAVAAVRERCGRPPERVSADSGFFSVANVRALAADGIDVYIPDSNQAAAFKPGGSDGFPGRVRDPVHRRLRRKMRTRRGRAEYAKRKTIVEPVIGVEKEQRGLRRFRRRGLAAVAVESALSWTAFNLTRLWRLAPALVT